MVMSLGLKYRGSVLWMGKKIPSSLALCPTKSPIQWALHEGKKKRPGRDAENASISCSG